jgi:hypothetical protein
MVSIAVAAAEEGKAFWTLKRANIAAWPQPDAFIHFPNSEDVTTW